jgi:hypothetical protein
MEKLKMGLEKIVIGYDELAYNDHIQQSSEKLGILGEAVAEFKSQCNTDVVDMAEFELSMYDYALNHIKEKHKGGLVLGLTDQAFILLYGYNFEKLKSIDARYLIQRGSLICVNNIFKIDESLDFRIFAENEYEVNRLNDCVELIKAVENIYSKYFIDRCSIQQINHFINKVYVTKPDGTGIEPNRFWIKQL